jgi:hypothetical protein
MDHHFWLIAKDLPLYAYLGHVLSAKKKEREPIGVGEEIFFNLNHKPYTIISGARITSSCTNFYLTKSMIPVHGYHGKKKHNEEHFWQT